MIDLKELQKPIDFQVRAQKVIQRGDGSYAALAVAYVNRADVQDRLDEVLGPENWKQRLTVLDPENHIVKCTLSICLPANGWVSREDIGCCENPEDVGDRWKGAATDALKRAANMFGIGRFLYRIDKAWIDCEAYEKNGKLYWKSWKKDPIEALKGSGAPIPKEDRTPMRPNDESTPASPEEPISKQRIGKIIAAWGRLSVGQETLEEASGKNAELWGEGEAAKFTIARDLIKKENLDPWPALKRAFGVEESLG